MCSLCKSKMCALNKVMEIFHLTLVSTDESKFTLKKYEKLWNYIRYLIRSITNNSENYEECMKIR